MSDDEMNIDEGEYCVPCHGSSQLTSLAANGGIVRRKGRGFQSSAGECVLCLCAGWLLNDVVLGGNESGVASQQTFDRVESSHGSETRAARCKLRFMLILKQY